MAGIYEHPAAAQRAAEGARFITLDVTDETVRGVLITALEEAEMVATDMASDAQQEKVGADEVEYWETTASTARYLHEEIKRQLEAWGAPEN